MYIKINLVDILERKGISNRKFSEITGIRHPTISDLCNNDTVQLPLDSLAKICLVLNCQISDILELIREPEKDPLYVLIGGQQESEEYIEEKNEIKINYKTKKSRRTLDESYVRNERGYVSVNRNIKDNN